MLLASELGPSILGYGKDRGGGGRTIAVVASPISVSGGSLVGGGKGVGAGCSAGGCGGGGWVCWLGGDGCEGVGRLVGGGGASSAMVKWEGGLWYLFTLNEGLMRVVLGLGGG